MKFMHLGDLHLGKSLGAFDLIEDQKYILSEILKLALENKVDGIFIAGDVYDKTIPSEAAVNLLDSFLNKLVENKIRVYMISGNHDSDERLNFGSSLFSSNNVYIDTKYDGKLHKYELEDEESGKVNIYMMPFIKASHVKQFYPEAEINSYNDAILTCINNSEIDSEATNILLAHQFVGGFGQKPEMAGSENIAVQNVGLVEMIDYKCFDAFNYVALGHIHSAQKIGREEVRYSGSPLKYSLSEVNNEKSVPIITVGKAGKIDIELFKLRPKRDLRHIKGKMEKLLSRENLKDIDDYIYITLTDEEFINDAMEIVQQSYPNAVKLDYDNSHTKEIQDSDFNQINQNRTFEELISDFYNLVYGCSISNDELKLINEIARKAGVADETN